MNRKPHILMNTERWGFVVYWQRWFKISLPRVFQCDVIFMQHFLCFCTYFQFQ